MIALFSASAPSGGVGRTREGGGGEGWSSDVRCEPTSETHVPTSSSQCANLGNPEESLRVLPQDTKYCTSPEGHGGSWRLVLASEGSHRCLTFSPHLAPLSTWDGPGSGKIAGNIQHIEPNLLSVTQLGNVTGPAFGRLLGDGGRGEIRCGVRVRIRCTQNPPLGDQPINMHRWYEGGRCVHSGADVASTQRTGTLRVIVTTDG